VGVGVAIYSPQYLKPAVDELYQEKVSHFQKLKYHNTISDTVTDLGNVEVIRDAFTGFQRFLYESVG